MKPELSVIITWYNRPELGRTLADNGPVFDRHGAEVIVVNCGGSERELREVLSGPGPRRLRRVDVRTTVFNKSLALNLGASVARSERLFLLDADIILKEDFLPTAFEAVAARSFFTIERVVESNPEPLPPQDHLEEMTTRLSFVGKGGRRATTVVRRRFHEGSRSAPGLVVLAREDFLQVGGMNADLLGYGWEDRDLLLRLQFALGLEERSAGAVIHLSHTDENQHEAWRDRRKGEQLNFAACLKNYRAGHYAGTYHDDLSVWKEKFVVEDR